MEDTKLYVTILPANQWNSIRTPLTNRILEKGQALQVDELERRTLQVKYGYVVDCDANGNILVSEKKPESVEIQSQSAQADAAPILQVIDSTPATRRRKRRKLNV